MGGESVFARSVALRLADLIDPVGQEKGIFADAPGDTEPRTFELPTGAVVSVCPSGSFGLPLLADRELLRYCLTLALERGTERVRFEPGIEPDEDALDRLCGVAFGVTRPDGYIEQFSLLPSYRQVVGPVVTETVVEVGSHVLAALRTREVMAKEGN